MPYMSYQENDQYCVYKLDADGKRTGNSLGCHDSKSEADGQVRALYASEKKSNAPDSVVELLKSRPSTNSFVVYKSKDSERLRWLARFSNNIRDDDYPVKEIISAEAHRMYEYMTDKGIVPYPQLWVWHEEMWNIGETDWIATDEVDGVVFTLASGEIHPHAEEVAKSLGELPDMAMSHGMPQQLIWRSESDPSIITGYVSVELSVLPKWSAANKHTSVYVLDSMEKKEMVRADKKAALEQTDPNVGSLLNLIEEQNSVIASQAKQLGLETKEAGESTDEESTAAETPDTTEETATEDTSKQTDTDASVETEAQQEEQEEVTDSTEEKSDGSVERNELISVLKAIGTRLEGIEQVVIDVNDRVNTLESAESRRKEQPLTTSLVDLISGSGINSVIGNPQTKVDGRTSLAKSKPEETEDKAQKGLFFEEFLS